MGSDSLFPQQEQYGLPKVSSIYKITRVLKQEQSSLYNCVNSILHDAAFVSEIRELYPQIPIYANLRCGLWYTRQFDGTCYFKSTDGHNGNWSFSCTRLNAHVCEVAARYGGCIIVDATRKGKKFPDSLTKTVPIWAAVINRSIKRYRDAQNQSQSAAQSSGRQSQRRPSLTEWLSSAAESVLSSREIAGACADKKHIEILEVNEIEEEDEPVFCPNYYEQGQEEVSTPRLFLHKETNIDSWDTELHLPLWISRNERMQIEAKLDGWVDLLMSMGADIAGLAKVLKKPLRPLWLNPSSLIWTDSVAQPAELPFCPLLLVSASEHKSYTRMAGGVLPGQGESEQNWTYVYLPGAGDDEESWATGLTPSLLYKHYQELVQAGPQGILSVLKRILHEQRVPTTLHTKPPQPRPTPRNGARRALPRRTSLLSLQLAEGGSDAHDSSTSNHGSEGECEAGGGARYSTSCQAGFFEVNSCSIQDKGGSSEVGDHGGERQGGSSGTDGWNGSEMVASHQLTCQSGTSATSDNYASHAASSNPSTANGKSLYQRRQLAPDDEHHPRPLGCSGFLGGTRVSMPASGVFLLGSYPLALACTAASAVSSEGGVIGLEQQPCWSWGDVLLHVGALPSAVSHVGQQVEMQGGNGSLEQRRTQPRINQPVTLDLRLQVGSMQDDTPAKQRAFWVQVMPHKRQRGSLQAALGNIIKLAHAHLAAGRTVLLTDDNGFDTCVCVAVALLIACFPSPVVNGLTSTPRSVIPELLFTAEGTVSALELVTKHSVRKNLAYVAAHYPQARPSRGMLRQVFNFFQQEEFPKQGNGHCSP